MLYDLWFVDSANNVAPCKAFSVEEDASDLAREFYDISSLDFCIPEELSPDGAAWSGRMGKHFFRTEAEAVARAISNIDDAIRELHIKRQALLERPVHA